MLNFKIPLEFSQLKKSYFSIVAFSAFINLLMLAPSWYMLMVYDRVLTSRDENTLFGLSIMMIYVYILFALLERYRGMVLIEISEKIDREISPKVNDLLTHGVGSVSRNVGALNDLNIVKQFLTGAPMLSFLDAPWSLLYLALMFLIHPALGWMSVISSIVLLLIAYFNQLLTHQLLLKVHETTANERKYVANIAASNESIRTMGMSSLISEQLVLIRNKFLDLHTNASGIGVNMAAVGKFFRNIIQSAALGYGAYLAINSEISGGLIIAGTILLGKILSPIEGIIGSWRQISEFRKSFSVVNEVLTDAPKYQHTITLGRPQGEITCRNVTLEMRLNAKPTLTNISLDVKSGQCLALIGPSGAGKTSLLKIMCGIYTPLKGDLLIDGSTLVHRDMNDLGQYIGYLAQNSELMAGKISVNISRNRDIESEKLIYAAKLSGAHETIISLPEGYETELGDHGHGLSEGQKRKIALARAFYANPALLFLDEPGNGLDEQSLRHVIDGILHFKSVGATIVLTTHQPALIALADQVALIVEGQLAMHGPRDQVIAKLTVK